VTPPLKQAVAFIFRRSAEPELTEEEFVRQVSLDLHWLAPRDARRFLDAARALGYVAAGGAPDRVRPGVDPGSVEVPLDFRLDARALEDAPAAAPGSVTDQLVAAAAARRGVPLDAVWQDVRQKAADKLLQETVAAALVAAESGVEVGPFLSRVNAELSRGDPPSPSASG
jgi:hypothetical protein